MLNEISQAVEALALRTEPVIIPGRFADEEFGSFRQSGYSYFTQFEGVLHQVNFVVDHRTSPDNYVTHYVKTIICLLFFDDGKVAVVKVTKSGYNGRPNSSAAESHSSKFELVYVPQGHEPRESREWVGNWPYQD